MKNLIHPNPLPLPETEDVPASQTEDPAAARSSNSDSSSTSGMSMDLVCSICFQDYNQDNRCPRMLECLHSFCTECLQRIPLRLCESAVRFCSLAIACPLCRHLTLIKSGDALTLPCDSHILSRLPQVDVHSEAAPSLVREQKVTRQICACLLLIVFSILFVTIITVCACYWGKSCII